MSGHDSVPDAPAPGAGSALELADADIDVSDFSVWDVPGLVALWGLAAIVFVQFFSRYVLNDSVAWTEEIARYVLILVAFFGAVSVTRKGTHIFLEFFYRYLSARAAKALAVTMELVSTGFYAYLAWLGVSLAQRTRTKMASVEIPKSLLYWLVTGSLAVMAAFAALWVVRKLRATPERVLQDLEAHVLHEAGVEVAPAATTIIPAAATTDPAAARRPGDRT